jgi:serum/glucocorticoid-regulated kinase 2
MGNCCKKKKDDALLDQEDPEKEIYNEDNPLGIKLKTDDFEKLKLIGKGSFGEVFLVKCKSNNKYYAMKVLDKQTIKKYNQEEHTKSERDLMVKVECPFVVGIKFAFQDTANLYLLTEFMQGGELFFHLFREKRFKNEKARFYLTEIILAIETLHKNKMIYRDLKPENVLIDKEGHIRITDFGLSKILNKDKEKTFTICGTPQYLAPEILSCEGYDDSVDWWSLGCIMYKMLTGIDAFRFNKDESLSPDMYDQTLYFPDYIQKEAKDLIKKLLTKDPKKRLGSGSDGAEKIKNHKYFSDIDWEKVKNKEYEPPFVPDLKGEIDLKYFDKGFTEERIDDYCEEEEPTSQNNEFKGFTYVTKSFPKNDIDDGRASNVSNNDNNNDIKNDNNNDSNNNKE